MRQSLFFGRRLQGKTTLALHEALKGNEGVAVYDINAQITVFPQATTSDLGLLSNWIDASSHRVVVYRPQRDVWAEFDGMAEILWSKRGYRLFVDEASQLQTASVAHPWLDRFVRMAPQRSVEILQTMHRPRDAATICRALGTDWFLFRTTLERDLEVIEEHCGGEAREAVSRFEEGSRHCFHWDDGRGVGEILARPELWFLKR